MSSLEKVTLENVLSGKCPPWKMSAPEKVLSGKMSCHRINILLFQVWMKDKWDRLENQDYVEKVLLPEALIKIYMVEFGLEKREAEKRIAETPLLKDDDWNSDEEI